MNMSTAPFERQRLLDIALEIVNLPVGIAIRTWTEADFPSIQRLSNVEGWTSATRRPEDSLLAWQHSWPALIAADNQEIVGVIRGLIDGAITTYIADMAVDVRHRRHGIGQALLEACHFLYPTARLDLLAVESAIPFYQACGFRLLHKAMLRSFV